MFDAHGLFVDILGLFACPTMRGRHERVAILLVHMDLLCVEINKLASPCAAGSLLIIRQPEVLGVVGTL